VPRLNVLDLQKLIRSMPKVVIALVAGYAIGGGHVLHVVCDLTIAADNGIFGQVGPKMGSFDGGFGSSYLARIVGQKKAREIWYLCRQYNAQQALDMGLVNKVVPVAKLEAEGVKWAKEILQHSPLAIRCLKSGFNAELDGQSGIQELAGNATLLYYMSDEAKEFHSAQREKRKSPDATEVPVVALRVEQPDRLPARGDAPQRAVLQAGRRGGVAEGKSPLTAGLRVALGGPDHEPAALMVHVGDGRRGVLLGGRSGTTDEERHR
jgi:hypothetical protein